MSQLLEVWQDLERQLQAAVRDMTQAEWDVRNSENPAEWGWYLDEWRAYWRWLERTVGKFRREVAETARWN